MEILGLRCWRGEPRRMAGAHWHNEIEWNWVESGAVEYLFGGAVVRVEAGQLAAFWGAVPHQIARLEGPVKLRWLTLPLEMFLGWRLPRGAVQSLLRGEVAVGNSLLDEALLENWERDLAHNELELQKIALLEMEARLRRLLLPFGTQKARFQASASELGRVEKMTAFVAQNYASELGIEAIARHAGLHPNYAMTLFKREFGLPLGEFLTRTRLFHAQRLLATTDRNVLEIGLFCGFGSASRFHAAFKRVCGTTPAAYRAGLR